MTRKKTEKSIKINRQRAREAFRGIDPERETEVTPYQAIEENLERIHELRRHGLTLARIHELVQEQIPIAFTTFRNYFYQAMDATAKEKDQELSDLEWNDLPDADELEAQIAQTRHET